MNKIFVILAISIVLSIDVKSQSKTNLKSLEGFWQNVREKSIIEVFHKDNYYTILKSKRGFKCYENEEKIGFFDSCNLPSIDSLKNKGKYFFIISKEEVQDKDLMNTFCQELSFYTSNDSTFFSNYSSYNQQYAVFYKLKELSTELKEYLKIEMPDVYAIYKSMYDKRR